MPAPAAARPADREPAAPSRARVGRAVTQLDLRAGRPAPTWQPARRTSGYAGGYEPQGSYIGTYSTDRYGYRTFRFDP